MTTQHTPGPWFANDSLQLFAENGQHIASLDSSTEGFEGGTLYANARLIAAAPLMLAVLQEIVETIDFERGATETEDAERLLIATRAAIAKATGEPA